MPRGKPRKTAPNIEVLPPDDDESPKQKVVEVKHKTEWSEMRPVDEAPDQETLFDDDDETPEPKPRRKTPNEREELRKKLARASITPGSQLKLTIEKYSHGEALDGQGGSYAEKEHCTKYVCAEDHITSEDYLDIARRYGPGLYRFTLRMRNQIVTAWDKRISAGTSPIIQHANPADPTSPQIIIGQNGDAAPAQMPSLKEYMRAQREALKEEFEMRKLFRELYWPAPEATPAQAPLDPKVAALQLIADNPEVMEKIGSGIAKTVLGSKGGGDSDPWADVAMEAIKNGQAAQIVREAIGALFNGINGLFPKANNGQAQMGAPQMAPMANQNTQPQAHGNAAPVHPHAEGQGHGAIQNGMGGIQGNESQGAPQVMMTPADALIIQLIAAMDRKAPLKEAQSIINVAVYRNPELDESIDELLNLSVDELMDLLAAYHPEIRQKEGAREWLETLTASLARSEEGAAA